MSYMPYRPRVLVIDDDPLFRNLVVAMLRKDYIVSVAGEGSEGFYKAIEHPPDVAIVDIQMPGWDGLKTLAAFRGHPQLCEIKIMMLTADASKETVLAAIHGGANDYLIKTSFSREEFAEKMAKLYPTSENQLSTQHTPDTEPQPVHAADQSMPDNTDMTGGDGELQELIDDWE